MDYHIAAMIDEKSNVFLEGKAVVCTLVLITVSLLLITVVSCGKQDNEIQPLEIYETTESAISWYRV